MDLSLIINKSLEEDIGFGDITTECIFSQTHNSTAFIIAKQQALISGLDIAMRVFKAVDNSLSFVVYKKDGDKVKKDDEVVKISGKTVSILKGERVALNFIQRLSGISTITDKFVREIKPHKAKLLDTRKTTPLYRELEKYAVRVGGGFNHRFGLYDMIMIKDNHIKAAGSITKAVKKVKHKNINYKIEVEVTNLDELKEAVAAEVDRVMLDNMPIEEMYKAVDLYGLHVELEASGNVNLENINRIASTGVHFISSGKITHSYDSIDLSLIFRE